MREMMADDVRQATVDVVLGMRRLYLAGGANPLKHWDQLASRIRSAAPLVPMRCLRPSASDRAMAHPQELVGSGRVRDARRHGLVALLLAESLPTGPRLVAEVRDVDVTSRRNDAWKGIVR